MSDQVCPNCDRLFEAKDVVKAVIVTTYVPLKSRIAYALEKPTECLSVQHVNCQWIKGEPTDD